MTQRRIHVHEYVLKAAENAADELYEELMKDNLLFAHWKAQNPGADAKELRRRFVLKNRAKCVKLARATIARILATSNDEDLKQTCYDALCQDSSLLRGRGRRFRPIFHT